MATPATAAATAVATAAATAAERYPNIQFRNHCTKEEGRTMQPILVLMVIILVSRKLPD